MMTNSILSFPFHLQESSGAILKLSIRTLFLLSLANMWQRKYYFGGQIFNIEILIDLHVLRSPQSENYIFCVWSVCMCVCLCVGYQHNSKANYSRNIKFDILHLYHVQMLLETFYKDRTKTLCTGAH